MGMENDKDILDRYSQAITAVEENGVVTLHVRPDLVIAEIRNRINELYSQKNDLQQRKFLLKVQITDKDSIIEAMPAERLNLLRNRKQEFQFIIDNSFRKSGQHRSADRDLQLCREESHNISLVSHQLGSLKTDLYNYDLAVTTKSLYEEELAGLQPEIDRLSRQIEEYDEAIIKILEACIKGE